MRKVFKTWDKKKGKMVVVGTLEGTVFTKIVSSKHFMCIEQGYGIQSYTLIQLLESGCKTVEIHSKYCNWKSELKQWLELVGKDYGHGLQSFLPIQKMETISYNVNRKMRKGGK